MSLDFNEFQAVRRRQKVDSNSVDKASARAEPEPLAPKPTPVDTVPGSGISARAGDFVELIEVQLLIVGLILLDVVASVFELLVMCGGGDRVASEVRQTKLHKRPHRPRRLTKVCWSTCGRVWIGGRHS